MSAYKWMRGVLWLLPLPALFTMPASAHHSTAQYNLLARVSYSGTVTKFEWQNPHAWIWLLVPQGNGTTREIGIECASPSALRSIGFKWDTVKRGDKVTLAAAPLRDGVPGGLLVSVKWADGRETVLPFVGILSHGADARRGGTGTAPPAAPPVSP